MRLVFMGTPDAAVPSLRALTEHFEVVEVYTRRDRPRGRGLHVAPSPVKVAATELGLAIRQPRNLREEAEHLEGLALDAIVVVAYGMILPADVLGAPRLGCVNVHFSLLPQWRGAAPVERAILAGDDTTGVTTMLMDPGLDTGPMLHSAAVRIEPDGTTGTLTERLAQLAPDLLVRTLRDLEADAVRPRPQDDGAATFAPKIESSEAALDPARPAAELERTVRAFDPAPGAFLQFRGRRLKVWRAAVVPGEGPAGTIVTDDPDAALATPSKREIAVQTSEGRLLLVEVQPEGKRRMLGEEFVRGYRPVPGEPVEAATA